MNMHVHATLCDAEGKIITNKLKMKKIFCDLPWKEDHLHDSKILHQDISLWLG
jgi:hypothetical protein